VIGALPPLAAATALLRRFRLAAALAAATLLKASHRDHFLPSAITPIADHSVQGHASINVTLVVS